LHERARDQWNGFDLFRIKDGEKAEWLLRKRLDLATRGGGRTEGGKQGDRGDRPGPAGDGALQAQLATLVRKPPSGGEWCYEVKWDGYRLLAEKSGRRITLRTRNGNDWTERFRSFLPALEKLHAKSWVVDGEAVVLDAPYRPGRSRDCLKIKCANRQEFVVVGTTPNPRVHARISAPCRWRAWRRAGGDIAERPGQSSRTRRCIEFYGWGNRVDRPRQADQLVFDLDPAGDVPWGKS